MQKIDNMKILKSLQETLERVEKNTNCLKKKVEV